MTIENLTSAAGYPYIQDNTIEKKLKVKNSTFQSDLTVETNIWNDGDSDEGRLILEDCTIGGDFNFHENNVAKGIIELKNTNIAGTITMYENTSEEFIFTY